jgi:hypothetical protein
MERKVLGRGLANDFQSSQTITDAFASIAMDIQKKGGIVCGSSGADYNDDEQISRGADYTMMTESSVGTKATTMSEASLHVQRKLIVMTLMYSLSVQWFASLLWASAAQGSSSLGSHGAVG